MSQPKRNWDAAHEKAMDEGGRCRVCRAQGTTQLAHVIGRAHDKDTPLFPENGWKPYDVHPDRVVPLCGPVPSSTSCHGRYDAHRLDLLPYLTTSEVLQAVADCSSVGSNGLEQARQRITGGTQ